MVGLCRFYVVLRVVNSAREADGGSLEEGSLNWKAAARITYRSGHLY